MATKYKYNPDYSVHVGDILEETLDARGIKHNEFAEKTGLTTKTVSQIINGKTSISSETAIHFERVLDISANLWINLDANHRLFVAKTKEKRVLESNISWLKSFPIKELCNKGFISSCNKSSETVSEMLNFFGVGSKEAWNKQYNRITAQYRKSPKYKSSFESLAVWLRICEIYAQNVSVTEFSLDKFKSALAEMRLLTTKDVSFFERRMRQLCADSGVALVFVSELKGTHLSGATRWLSGGTPLIMLSLRHKTDDHLWFTFFHEAAHIIKHGKKDVFIDEVDMSSNELEQEANNFAANYLIPNQEYRSFISRGKFFISDIKRFARSIDIAPGIVVGRLQHDEYIQHNWHNKLKRSFTLIESSNH